MKFQDLDSVDVDLLNIIVKTNKPTFTSIWNLCNCAVYSLLVVEVGDRRWECVVAGRYNEDHCRKLWETEKWRFRPINTKTTVG
jgi:hypothetical protein